MIMSPSLRKFVLIVHISSSVGWIGTVLAYLVLVYIAMNRQNYQTLFSAWMAMDWIGWLAIVPLSLSSFLTGLIISLGTKWGLFRHYWVLISLGLTIFACVILVQHMQTVSFFAGIAAQLDETRVTELSNSLGSELFHAGLGLLLLIVIQVLNVYKPRGLTPYGWRKQQEEPALRQAKTADS
jgi:hypothetical protein